MVPRRFYQAFGSSLATEHLGTTSPLVAATLFAAVMMAKLSPAAALRLGMILFVGALAAILMSLHAGAFVPLVAASLVVGLAQGGASTAGIGASAA